MSVFFMHLYIFFISFSTNFVNKREYTQKVETIKPSKMEIVHGDWVAKTVISPKTNETFRYYDLQSGSDVNSSPIIFLHGLNFDGRVFQKLDSLSYNRRLISIELPYTSSVYKGNIDDYVDIIDSYITLLGLKKVILVGTSFGGVIAVRYSAKRAHNIERLVLISTKLTGATRRDMKQSISLDKMLNRKDDYQIYWIMEKLIDKFLKKFSGNELIDMKNLLNVRSPSFYRQVSSTTKGYCNIVDFKSITAPILAINGEDDHIITMDDVKKRTEISPSINQIIVKGGTHGLVWNRSSLIATEISKFIEKEPKK